MPDHRRRWCKGCRQHTSEAGPLSWSGLCVSCWQANVRENVLGLRSMTGPAVNRWRRGMAACVGAVLLDDKPPDD